MSIGVRHISQTTCVLSCDNGKSRSQLMFLTFCKAFFSQNCENINMKGTVGLNIPVGQFRRKAVSQSYVGTSEFHVACVVVFQRGLTFTSHQPHREKVLQMSRP